MNLTDIDHVAIAVKDLKRAISTYEDLLGVKAHQEHVEDQGVQVGSFSLEHTRIELIAPDGPDSDLHGFLDNHGEGLHHLALRTDDVQEGLDQAADSGFQCLDDQPRDGAQGYRIGFLHPGDLHGVLTELAQPAE